MKINDISLDRTQEFKNLSDNEAINITGGTDGRNGPSDGCPPQRGKLRVLNSYIDIGNFSSMIKYSF